VRGLIYIRAKGDPGVEGEGEGEGGADERADPTPPCARVATEGGGGGGGGGPLKLLVV